MVLIFLLKITGLLDLALKIFKVDNNEIVDIGSSRVNKTIANLLKNDKFRNSIGISNIKATKEPIFLISNAKKALNYLKKAFIKTLIFWHFDLES